MRHLPDRPAGVVLLTVLATTVGLGGLCLDAQSTGAGVPGRWEFTYEAAAPGRAGGAGRGDGTGGRNTAPGRDAGGRGVGTKSAGPGSGRPSFMRTITLDLKVAPGNTLTGTFASSSSAARGGAPGNNPLRPVEISDGTIDGDRVSFSAWQFDGYKNRLRFSGVLDGDSLRLTMSRETAAGPEKIDAIARRLPY